MNVDFMLGNLRVELGFCTRKLCDGACMSRSRNVHCASYPILHRQAVATQLAKAAAATARECPEFD